MTGATKKLIRERVEDLTKVTNMNLEFIKRDEESLKILNEQNKNYGEEIKGLLMDLNNG